MKFKIESDKLLHFLTTYAIILSTFLIFHNLLIAVSVATILGVGKEIYDIKKTGFSKLDLMADGIGILIGTIFIALVK